MVINEIARLIAEEEEFDKCPSCGDENAIVGDEGVACANYECPNYNEGYFETVLAIHPIEVETYFTSVHEADLEDVLYLAERAAETGNVRLVPWDQSHCDWAIVVWKGLKNVPDELLTKALDEYDY